MFELFRQFFLNPQALAGTALIGVPIVIYLINRHKYQRRKWAAMTFLLRALQRNQRRIQLQNWLLLLVRVLVVLFLALAIARPVFRDSPLAVAPDANQNWVLVVDTSYSMGLQEGARSLFNQTRETVMQLADNVFNVGDRVAVVTLAEKPRVILPPTPVTPESRNVLRQELERLTLSAQGVDLGASFQLLDEVCQRFVTPIGDPEPKRIVIFSDFQRKDWLLESEPRDATLAGTLKKIQDGMGEFALAKGGYGTAPLNLAVTSLVAKPPLIAQDVWVEFRATVQNFGGETARNIDLSLRVDPETDPVEGSEPQLGNVLEIPAGGVGASSLAYRFDEPGHHTVVAELRSDGLLIDNSRYLVVRVEDEVKVLLVDGEPDADPLERETFHLELALRPEDDALAGAGGHFTPFRPEYVTFDRLADVTLREYAVVALANVSAPADAEAEALRRYVADGGSLLVFLGDRVDAPDYNRLFGSGETPLMPFELVEVQGDPRYPVPLQPDDPAHPVSRYFLEHIEAMNLGLISFGKYFTTRLGESVASSLRVPFRYGDLERNPAVLDNGFGKGRVLWVTSSADIEWNDFAKWPDSIVFLYETISYLVRFGAESLNLEIGESFQKSYDASEYASEVTLYAPQERSEEFQQDSSVPKDMRELEVAGEFEITHDQTTLPGLYRLELERPNRPQPDTTEFFAVNVDTAEGDLRPILEEDLRTHFPEFAFRVFDPGEDLREAAQEQGMLRGREHARSFLYIVLGLLILETVLAYFYGRRAQ